MPYFQIPKQSQFLTSFYSESSLFQVRSKEDMLAIHHAAKTIYSGTG